MKPIAEFAKRVNASTFSLSDEFVLEEGGRYFLLNSPLSRYVQKGFFYAGTYLGKFKDGQFFPSFNLLSMLAKSGARSVTVDKKAAWLFVCSRDIFAKSIVTVHGSAKKGDTVLVLNQLGECLGFGRATLSMCSRAKPNQIAVKNLSDIGDFLRRER